MGLYFNSKRKLKVIAFTDESRVPQDHFLSGVDVVLPISGKQNEMAFATLVSEMIETKKVMIGRFEKTVKAPPQLVGLFPSVIKKSPLLYMV
jgi:hypothetical protein